MTSEAAIHHKQLTKKLRENSSYPDASSRSIESICEEWIVIQTTYDPKAGEKCICGKENIHHHNTIKNRFNGMVLGPIGSKCVKRFHIKQLEIYCMCCRDLLGETNQFLKAYSSYTPVTKETRIIGHKKCSEKFFRNAYVWGWNKGYLEKEFVSYFESLGVRIRMCADRSFEYLYEDQNITPYIDLL
jgi:hypothetical protein